MKKQGVIYGSLILVVSVFITKVLGLIYKIPITNLLGGTGMGYFSTAYSIFMPIYAVSVTGLPSAVSRLVAENVAFKRYKNVKKIRRVAVFTFSIIGIIATILLIALARPLTSHVIVNEGAYWSVVFIAPCLYFGAVTAVYRGYYEGLQNMFPTAISQILEALTKMIAGLGLAYIASDYFETMYTTTGKIFNTVCENPQIAQQISLPYVAAASILGVTLADVVSFLYVIIRFRLFKDGITEKQLAQDSSTDRMRYLLQNLVKLVIPIALGSLISNLTSLIDIATIIRSLKIAISSYPVYFISKFGGVIDESNKLQVLPNFIYGSFTGLALTIFNLVPSITGMFGKGVMPNLSEAWAIKKTHIVHRNINSVLFITGIFAFPAGLGISVLSKEILELLYSSRPYEILASYESLTVLGVGVIFLSISVPVFSMLQAIGRTDIPIILLFVGVGIKVLGNITLIRIPQLNITGAAISTSMCYLVICVISIIWLISITKTKLDITRLFLKPLFAAILCAISAKMSYIYLMQAYPSKITLLISIVLGGIIYIFVLALLDIMPKKPLKLLK